MNPSGWSELPSDIFLLITPRLDTLHILRCSAVCTNWNRHLRSNPRRRLPLPFLLLSPSSSSFFSLADQTSFIIPDPTECHITHTIIGTSSSGFLLTLQLQNHNLSATNPLTGSHLHFPPLPSPPPHFSVLSSDNTAAVFRSPSAPPSFARPGDATWTDLRSPPDLYFANAVFHKGLLHAVSLKGRSAAFDLDRPMEEPALSRNAILVDNTSFSRHLVEAPDGDKLFQVIRFLHSKMGSTRLVFKVFKFDEERFTWEEVGSIGDLIFFLDFRGSFALKVGEDNDDIEIRRNCIYFLSDPLLDCFDSASVDSVGSPLGVFDLETGTSKRISVGNDVDHVSWPLCVWLPVPSLSYL